MNCPESLLSIHSGRSTKYDYIKKNYPEFFDFLIKNYSEDLPFNERLYWYYNNLTEHPKCPVCGKNTSFISNLRGYAQHCCPTCTQLDKNVREKNTKTNIERYGEDFIKKIVNSGRKTKLEKYGDANYNNIQKLKSTCIEKYGVDNPMKCESIKEKNRQTCLERYGATSYSASDEFKKRKDEILEKSRNTSIERYGVESPMQLDSMKEKIKKTCLERYGVEWNCMRPEAHNSRNSKSYSNELFACMLDENKIQYEREFAINNFVYDFKIDSILVEINPSPTHNVNWNPFSDKKIIDKNYHLEKTKNANKNGYRCIHVWDWDSYEKIINLLKKSEQKIYARECTIKEITKDECDDFLNKYHLQNTARNQKIRIGLFYNDELVQLITLGKPRYNKNYEYEIIRICSNMEYLVVGGISKLFSYILEKYKPTSLITYCDVSKFDGTTYEKLGFTLLRKSGPSCNWINLKTKKRISDNELRKLGADAIFGTNFGKGTSNTSIMKKQAWVQVYDCGQKTYIWKNDKINIETSNN